MTSGGPGLICPKVLRRETADPLNLCVCVCALTREMTLLYFVFCVFRLIMVAFFVVI